MDPTQDVPTHSQAEDQTLRTANHGCRCEATTLSIDDHFKSSMDSQEARAQIIVSKFSAAASAGVGVANPPLETGADLEEAADAHPTASEPGPHNPEEAWLTRLHDAYENAE